MHEVKLIIEEALKLQYYSVLEQILRTELQIDVTKDIYVCDLIRALNHSKFINQVPFANGRETFSNIKLIIHALIIIKKGYLEFKDFRDALHAITLVEKHY